jgi:hypothetical protein
VRDEAVDLDRPQVFARLVGNLVEDVWPVVERAAELLEEDGGVEETEVLALQDADPAERRELVQRRRRIRVEKGASFAAEIVLLGGEGEVQGLS